MGSSQGDDVDLCAGQLGHCGRERRRLAATGRARREERALPPREDLAQAGEIVRGQPERGQVGRRVTGVEEAQYGLFTEMRGDGGHPDGQLRVPVSDGEPPVLRPSAHRDVEPGHDLHARYRRAVGARRQLGGRGQPAVDAQPDPRTGPERLDVDVACATVDCRRDQVVDDPDDGPSAGLLFKDAQPPPFPPGRPGSRGGRGVPGVPRHTRRAPSGPPPRAVPPPPPHDTRSESAVRRSPRCRGDWPWRPSTAAP